jgi:hypothetical protein
MKPAQGSTAGRFNPLPPTRIFDSRTGSGEPGAGQTLGPNSSLDVQVTGAGGVPAAGVSAVAFNLTVTDTTMPTFVAAYPTPSGSSGPPTASNVNLGAFSTAPNRVVVPVGAGGKVRLFNSQGNADVVVDVDGWYTDGSDPNATGGLFTAMTPTRICDTRLSGTSCPSGQVGSGSGNAITVVVAGSDGIPSSSAPNAPIAIVENVTVQAPSQSSFLTTYPSGSQAPLASDLNFVPGQTVANLCVTKLGPDGNIKVLNAVGSVSVIVDVAGFFS